MQTQPVGADEARHLGRDLQPQPDRAVPQLRLEQADGTVHGGQHIERLRAGLQLAGLDLGEIQHVVHHPQQRGAGALQALRVLLLRRLQGGAQQHVGVADDGVHRCADLVAHVGDEVGLGRVGGFRCTQGQAGLGLTADGLLQILALQGLAVHQFAHLAPHLQAHAREGLHEHAQFVLAFRVELHLVVGGLYVTRCHRQRGQRPRQGMAEGRQQGREDQQAKQADECQRPQQRLPGLGQRAARQPELHPPQHLPPNLQRCLEVQGGLRSRGRGGLVQLGRTGHCRCRPGPVFRNQAPGGIAHTDEHQIARGARLGQDGRHGGEIALGQGRGQRRIEQRLELPHARFQLLLQVAVHQRGHAQRHGGQHQNLQ